MTPTFVHCDMKVITMFFVYHNSQLYKSYMCGLVLTIVYICECLQRDQLMICSLFCHEFRVMTRLHDMTVVNDVDDISCLNGGQAVGNNNSGSTFTGLWHKKYDL